MDYRNLFGIAAIILSGAVFVHSLKSANAFPQGPNVSMGSNPIESFYGCTISGATIFTNTSNYNFIITDVTTQEPLQSNISTLRINGQNVFSSTHSTHFFSGIKVLPSDVVTCYGGYPTTISGYYTH